MLEALVRQVGALGRRHGWCGDQSVDLLTREAAVSGRCKKDREFSLICPARDGGGVDSEQRSNLSRGVGGL